MKKGKVESQGHLDRETWEQHGRPDWTLRGLHGVVSTPPQPACQVFSTVLSESSLYPPGEYLLVAEAGWDTYAERVRVKMRWPDPPPAAQDCTRAGTKEEPHEPSAWAAKYSNGHWINWVASEGQPKPGDIAIVKPHPEQHRSGSRCYAEVMAVYPATNSPDELDQGYEPSGRYYYPVRLRVIGSVPGAPEADSGWMAPEWSSEEADAAYSNKHRSLYRLPPRARARSWGGRRPGSGAKPKASQPRDNKLQLRLSSNELLRVDVAAEEGSGKRGVEMREAMRGLLNEPLTYYITPDMLGDEATDDDAVTMADALEGLLRADGYEGIEVVVSTIERRNPVALQELLDRYWGAALGLI